MKIEAGKWYRDSKGNVVKITDAFEGFFTGNNGTIYNRHGGTVNVENTILVAEVPELSIGDWYIATGRPPEGEFTAALLRDGRIMTPEENKGVSRWTQMGFRGDIVAYCTSPWEVAEPAPERTESDKVFPDIAEENRAAGEVKMRREFDAEKANTKTDKPAQRVVHAGDPISVSDIVVQFSGRELAFKAKLDDTRVYITVDEDDLKATIEKLKVGVDGCAPQPGLISRDEFLAGFLALKPGMVQPSTDEEFDIAFAAPAVDMAEPGYESLADVLQRAYNQAAKGKGKERHARGEPFDEQVMQEGAFRFGVGALLFQAYKKSEESQRLPLDRGINELLGAIVYLAGAVIARERVEGL